MHVISNPLHNPVKSFPLSLLYKGEGHGKPFQYPCLENPMEEEGGRFIVHGVTKSRTWLSDFTSLTLQRRKCIQRPFHQNFPSTLTVSNTTEHQIHWGPEPVYSLPYPHQCWAQAWHLQWWNMQVSDGLSQCKPQSHQPDQPGWNALLLKSDLFQPCILLHLPQRRTRLGFVSGWCLLNLSKGDFPQQTPHWAPASFLFSISLLPQNYCDLGTLQ